MTNKNKTIKRNIIIFYGTKGVGKDTCFEILQKQLFFNHGYNVRQLSFAENLKQIVWSLFKTKIIDKKRIFGVISEKEKEIKKWEIPETIKISCNFKEKYWSGRRLLQWFGTEVCRTVYDNVWIDAFLDNFEQLKNITDFFVITDCRFKNEYDVIQSLKKNFNVKFVKIIRNTDNNNFNTHASEQDIENFEYDALIVNDKSVEDLEPIIKLLIKNHINTID